MNIEFVDLPAQDLPIRDEVRDALLSVFDRGDYILGKAVAEFEAAFATYCGTRHAIAVDNGLAALKLILHGYGIGPGDDVIVPAHTFVATAGAVAMAGARPVLVDVLADDYTIDPERVADAITPTTRAIIGVHLYGRPFDVPALRELADHHGLVLIEDAAQAHGARYGAQRSGALGHAAAFSFYPTKNLGASGDAGIVTTDDHELALRIRALRNCGQFEKNDHQLMPFNHRMDTVQAAILLVRLRKLDTWNQARRTAAARYRTMLHDLPIMLPPDDEPGRESVFHLYVIASERRDALAAHLATRGIPTAVHYPIPVHLQGAFRELGYTEGAFPIAEAHANRILSLPMHPNLSDAGGHAVAKAVREFVEAL